MNLDLFVSLFLFLASLVMGIISFTKSKQINTAHSLSIIFFFTFILISVNSFVFYSERISFDMFQRYRSLMVLFTNTLIVTAFGMLSIESLTHRKIKTLWRLPIIGLLLGFFEVEHHRFILLGLGVILLFLLVKNISRLRVLHLRGVVHIALVALSFFANGYYFWASESVLILILLNIFPLWDMLRLKQNMIKV